MDDVSWGQVSDTDDDGVPDEDDFCPATTPGAPVDTVGCSDAEVDRDNDGICDPDTPSGGPSNCTGVDNCPVDSNPSQMNSDGDLEGDLCDADDDNDGDSDVAENACGSNPLDASDSCTTAGSDADNDGVADSDDVCPATAIPEAVPTSRLGLGWYRWALDNPDGPFTQRRRGRWSHFNFTTEDTRGCSCDQIIAETRLPRYFRKINQKYGCSTLLMLHWVRNP